MARLYLVPADRFHFRHLKGEPPMKLVSEADAITADLFDENICETYRSERQIVFPPRVCACGEYDLKWER